LVPSKRSERKDCLTNDRKSSAYLLARPCSSVTPASMEPFEYALDNASETASLGLCTRIPVLWSMSNVKGRKSGMSSPFVGLSSGA